MQLEKKRVPDETEPYTLFQTVPAVAMANANKRADSLARRFAQ